MEQKLKTLEPRCRTRPSCNIPLEILRYFPGKYTGYLGRTKSHLYLELKPHLAHFSPRDDNIDLGQSDRE